MSLFNIGEFTLHSGQKSDFLIDCNALTDEDLNALAYKVAKAIKFAVVVGIPRGGLKFANALQSYCTGNAGDGILIADDVCTTGSSFRDFVKENFAETPKHLIKGVVIFKRGVTPEWVTPILILG